MTVLNNDLVSVLRRRARKLQADGYGDTFATTIMIAADELAVRRRCETPESAEQEAVEAVNDNRMLGKCLENLARIIESSSMATALKEQCGGELRKASLLSRPGEKRRIVAIGLEPGTTMAEFMIKARELYERYAVDAEPPMPREDVDPRD